MMFKVYFAAVVLTFSASYAVAQSATIGHSSSPGYVAPMIQSPPSNTQAPNIPPTQQLMPDVGAPGYLAIPGSPSRERR